MPSLVATIELYVADRRNRNRVFSQRASYGDLEGFTQQTLSIPIGTERTFEFARCFYAHFRDVIDVTLYDSNNNEVVYLNVEGGLSLPTGGKVKLSVDAGSNIILDRVVQVLYS